METQKITFKKMAFTSGYTVKAIIEDYKNSPSDAEILEAFRNNKHSKVNGVRLSVYQSLGKNDMFIRNVI